MSVSTGFLSVRDRHALSSWALMLEDEQRLPSYAAIPCGDTVYGLKRVRTLWNRRERRMERVPILQTDVVELDPDRRLYVVAERRRLEAGLVTGRRETYERLFDGIDVIVPGYADPFPIGSGPLAGRRAVGVDHVGARLRVALDDIEKGVSRITDPELAAEATKVALSVRDALELVRAQSVLFSIDW